MTTMMTMSGFAPVPSLPRHGKNWHLGPVGWMIAAYFGFIGVSMLCFGILTLLSLLP